MTQPPAQPDRPAYAPQPEYVEPVSRFNAPVAVLAVIAAVLGVLSIAVLDWYRDDGKLTDGGDSRFSDVRTLVDSIKDISGASTHVSPFYFDWLGYVLIGLAVVGAFLCAVAAAAALRTLTAIVSVVGIALTLWAIQLFTIDNGSNGTLTTSSDLGYGSWFKHTSFGAWAMLLAFVLCFVAALIRPRRQRSRGY